MGLFFVQVCFYFFVLSLPSTKCSDSNHRRWNAICKKKTSGGLAYRNCMREQKESYENSIKPRMRKPDNIYEIEDSLPNILLISTDQQRRDTLGCYEDEVGFRNRFSPNIDRLAKQGVRFTQAFSASPSCTPSRTSMLLGVHVPIHTIVENGLNNWNQKFIPFTDVLMESGYETVLFGKSGFMPIPKSLSSSTPMQYQLETDSPDGLKNNANMLAGSASWVLELERTHPHERRINNTNQFEFLETFLVNETMKWIQHVSTSPTVDKQVRPWFAYLSMLSPHGPNIIPTEWQNPFSAKSDLPTMNHVRDQDGSLLPKQTLFLLKRNNLTTDQLELKRRNYYAQAAYVDDQVGRMVRFIDEYDKEQQRGTLIIFTSDHGSMLFDHGLDDKHTLHTEALHVPLIMRWPSKIQPGSTAKFASLIDLPASILSIARAGIPAYYQGFDVISPLLQRTQDMMIAPPHHQRVCIAASDMLGYGVVSNEWKLWYYPISKECALFNRFNDPGEHVNLFQEDRAMFDNVTSLEYSLSLYLVQQQLLVALLRWRARQDDLLQMWEQISKGPKYVGTFTTKVFEYLESMSGIDSEQGLQNDCILVEKLSQLL